MATSKKITGALSLSPPTDTEVVDYNGKIDGLIGQLTRGDEDSGKDETLAWGAGLTDPSGNGQFGGALSSANKSVLEQRNKDRELKSLYIPHIINALGMQQQSAQLARLAAGQGAGGGMDLIGLDPNRLPLFAQATGQKLSDVTTLWKEANKPDAMQGGTWQRFPKKGGGFDERYIANAKDGITYDDKGNVINIPGSVDAAAQSTYATEDAKQQATLGRTFVKRTAPDGTPYEVPLTQERPEWFGRPGQGLPPPAAANPAQGPAQPSTMPPQGGMPPATMPAGPAGPMPARKVTPQQQAERDNDIPAILSSEMRKAQTNLAAAAPGSDDARRAQEDIESITRELGRLKQPVRAPGVAPVVTPAAAPAAAPTAPGMPQTGALPPGAAQTGVSPRVELSNKALGEINTGFLKNSYQPVLDAGDGAQKNLDTISSARMALKSMNTGWGADAVTTGAQVLGALGVPQAKERAANAEIFRSTANAGIQERLALQKGPQTDQDAKRDAATWATVQNTTKANAYILDKAQAVAEREKVKADYYRKALPIAQKSGDLSEIDRRWASRAPSLFDMPSMRRWNTEKKE